MKLSAKMSNLWKTYDTAIWIRAIGTALTSITNFMMRPFLVLYLYNRLEGDVFMSMLVVSLSPFMGMLVGLFAGKLSDRVGRKPVMLASLLIQCGSMLAFMAATSVWHYALISIFSGIGHALFYPAANAQVSDVVPADKRPEVFALFHTALNLGAAAGPLLGLLLYNWNMQLVFFACAVTTAIYAFLLWWKVPETLQTGLAASPTAAAETSPASGKAESFSLPGWIKKHKLLVSITLSSMPVTLLYALVESAFPLHLQTRFTNYQAIFAGLMTFNGLMVILLQIWIARKTANMALHRVMGIAYSLFALVALGYGFAPWIVLLFAVEFVFTIGEMMNGPHSQKLVSVIAPPEERGFYFSFYSMNWQVSRFVGPLLGGLVLSKLNGEWLFGLLGLLIVAGGISMFFVCKAYYQRTVSSASGAARSGEPAAAAEVSA
ncbi:MAG: transporter [Paenibacillaceae bacterium]|jgi:MFS family permease|nr:transporter [Paenibacillaceae bacterium]